MRWSVNKRCPECDEFCIANGADYLDYNMPDDYCPTCKENCCELDITYEEDGTVIILEEVN